MSIKPTPPVFQTRDLLIPLGDPLDAQSTISVWDFGALRFYHNSPGRQTVLTKAPIPSSVFIRPREGTKERAELHRASDVLTAALADGRGESKTIAEASATLSGQSLSPQFADGVLRALIGIGTLIASKDKSGTIRIKLSSDARARERRRAYSASFANDLASQSEQLGRLIGHGATVGSEREELFRALLERHVPRRYHVATGFVDGLPQQFDIIIYDQIDHAALLRTGNLVVVPSESVRAVIEIKSTLDATTLADALEHLQAAMFIAGAGPPVFRGVFAYSGVGARAISKAVRRFHRPIEDDTPIDDNTPEPVVSIVQMVNAVCVLGKAMVRTTFAEMPVGSKFPWVPATVTMDSAAGWSSQGGAFFDLLDRYLRHPYVGPFERSTLMDVVRGDMLSSEVTPFYTNEDWAAPFLMLDDGEAFDDRIRALSDWLAGGAWREEEVSP